MLLPSLAASFHGAECELKLEQDWSVLFQSCLGARQAQAKAAEDVSTRRAHKRFFKQSFCLLGHVRKAAIHGIRGRSQEANSSRRSSSDP
jgi:hypothetical protein